MVAVRVDVVSRRAGASEAGSVVDGKGSNSVSARWRRRSAGARHPGVVLHLLDDAKTYASKWTVERFIREQSGHVAVSDRDFRQGGEAAVQVSDGTALWTKSKSEVTEADMPTSIAAFPASMTIRR